MSGRDDAAVDREPLSFGRLTVIGVIGIVLALLSVAWSAHFIRRAAQVGSVADVGEATHAVIGGLLVSRPNPTPEPIADHARAEARLTGWGWTDARHTTVHLPIDLAMQAVLLSLAPSTTAPASTPAPPPLDGPP